jgi:uncharacterized protein (DUF885 family)
MIKFATAFTLFFVLAVHHAGAGTAPTSYEKKCRALIQAKGKKAESARLREMFDLQWNHMMVTYPEWATYVGYKGQNDRWTDRSLEAIKLRDRESLCQLDMAKSFRRTKLKGREVLDYDLFLDSARRAVENQRFLGEYLVVNQMGGVQHDIAELLMVMPTATEADFKNILARLRGAGKVIDDSIILLQEGLKAKVTPPKITLRDVPGQIDKLITEKPLDSAILKPFVEIPASIPKEKAEALRAEAVKIFTAEVKPKLQNLRKFLTETYIPGARETIAWKDLPDGEAWYAKRLKDTTTTELTAQQIHQIGLDEVARINKEMEQVMKDAKFTGGFEKFQKKMRTDKRFYYTDAGQLIHDYRALAKRVDPELVKLFGKLPRTPYGIEPVPSYAEKSSAAAYYQGGSQEAGRPGIFYANTYDLKSRPKWEMEALTFHEAVPGHHFQIALAQEIEEGPEFRKYSHYTAYTEGWGLYAESLGYEMGFYKDPYSRFGQLTLEMWRAVRLVVDTGMHALGWSRQQAIDYMKKHVAKEEHDLIVEIDRYIVWAGQATAYKIGQLKFKELREKASGALGDRFDIRKFHDTVLSKGAVPLNVLESLVQDYISREQAAPAKRI